MRIDELKQEKHLTDVDVVIIGGESIYRQFLPFCDTAQITWIDFSYVADTHMVDSGERRLGTGKTKRRADIFQFVL